MKKEIKQIATIGVIIFGMLVAMFFLIYQEYEYTFIREQRVEETARLGETELNKSLYKALKRESQTKTDRVANEIRQKLIDNYGNNIDNFAKEYDNPTEDSILVTTIDSVINSDDNRFFYIESDSNDMFALSKNNVISDKSENCSIEGIPRILEQESDMHYNKELANQSINGLLYGNRKHMFWRFSNTILSKNDDNIKVMDIDKVLSLPRLQLKDYEFLTVSYIDKYGDILGIQDVTSLGQKKDSKKLMVVQGFNMFEQIEGEFKESYLKLHKNNKLQLAVIEESRKGLVTKLILMMALLLISFFAMAIMQNIFIKGCEVNEFK